MALSLESLHMRAGRPHREETDAECRERLTEQVAELEHRIRLLEARLRRMGVEPPAAAAGAAPEATATPAAKKARVPKPRPRCPGCLLELPRGRRKAETCVWCGFRFDAVRPWVTEQASK